MQGETKYIIPIPKDLKEEADIKEGVAYYPMAGESRMQNFRSPDAYVFILFEQAKGEHQVDFVSYEQQDRQLHISFPGQIHSWDTPSHCYGHKLIVSKRFAELYMLETVFIKSKINRCPVFEIDAYACAALVEDFTKLGQELAKPAQEWKMIMLRALIVIVTINNLSETHLAERLPEDKMPTTLRRYFALIDLHYQDIRAVSDYARMLHLSPNYLSVLCRKHLGLSAKEVIDQRVLLEAKRLLLGSEFSIKEVSNMLKFIDMPMFSSYIKSKTGLSPKELRQGR